MSAKPQRQRLLRVGDRDLDQLLLLTPLRHRDLDLALGAHGQRLGKQRLLGQGLGQEQQRRRLPLAIELGDEGLHDLCQLAVLGVCRVVGAIAVVPTAPIEEDLDAYLPSGAMRGDHVCVFHGRGVDSLPALDVGQRLQAVAERGGRLEVAADPRPPPSAP